MKMNYGQMLQLVENANKTDFANWELPIGFSLQITRVLGKMEEELRIFHEERMKVVKKHAELDKDGNVKVDDNQQAVLKDYEAFEKEFKEMYMEEIDLNVNKVKADMDKLSDQGVFKKPSEISWLLPLLEFEDEG